MKSSTGSASAKRPINLSLDEEIVRSARGVTDNLSQVVEALLSDYVARERARRDAQMRVGIATAALWNDFDARRGSFADEHSTL